MTREIIKHKGLRCLKCGSEIFSTHVHDFKRCECGAIAVDGGFDYHKWTGEREDFVEIEKDFTKIIYNEEEQDERRKKLWETIMFGWESD